MMMLFIWPYWTYSEIFVDLTGKKIFFIFKMDDDLDCSPLTQYWMLIKWIIVSSGNEIELFDYGKLSKDNDVCI